MARGRNHAGTMVCSRCGREKPAADFASRRRGGKNRPKCWVCRYLAARTPRGRLAALPPDPFAPGGAAARSDQGGAKLTRTCRKCGVEKPLGEFYLDRATGRRTSPCRRCIRAAMRRYYAENRERLVPLRRRWAAQEDPEQRRARHRRCRERNRLKVAVRVRTNRLRALGLLTLEPECADCGGPAADLHHETYGDVLALVSLCRRCHMARHYRHWRKHGGGPVKYPWEHEEEEGEQGRRQKREGVTAKNAKGRE